MIFYILFVLSLLSLAYKLELLYRNYRVGKAIELLERSMPGVDIIEYYKTNPIL